MLFSSGVGEGWLGYEHLYGCVYLYKLFKASIHLLIILWVSISSWIRLYIFMDLSNAMFVCPTYVPCLELVTISFLCCCCLFFLLELSWSHRSDVIESF